MHICFVLRGYPTPKDPYQTFSRELIGQIAKMGIKCSVVAPQSVTRALAHRVPIRPVFWKDQIEEGVTVEVYQPYYFTTSNFRLKIVKRQRINAAKRAVKRIPEKIDVIYGHFWDMGVFAAKTVENGAHIFVGCGEASIEKILKRVSPDDLALLRQRLHGVIYVSSNAYREACKLGLQRENDKYLIAPNGYNTTMFYKMDRTQCRKKLGFSTEDFIVSFVGSFDERKGVDRLIDAVKDDKDIKLVLIGKGKQIQTNEQIIHAGGLPHDEIVTYLNASDVFVLPTRAEGCCNAIVEAVACGLPIISSVGEFNDDILDSSNSIRINPDSVSEIKEAIEELRNNPKRCNELSEGSTAIAERLTIEARATKILEFMLNNGESLINEL